VKTVFKNQFAKQIENIKDSKLKTGVLDIILKIEKCNSISEISNLKKLKGFKDFYRIRIGDYRVGIKVEKDTVTFAAFHHRKDIYKYFP
jgi:mRNA interferase RelE/StbE